MPARPPRSRSWWTRLAGSRSQIAGRGAPKATVPSGARRCRSCRRARMARSRGPAVSDRLALVQSGMRPTVRQRPRPDGEIADGEASLDTPSDYWLRAWLLRLDTRRLDDRPPFLGLGLVEGMKRFRGLFVAWEYLLTDVGEPLAYRRIGERGNHRAVELHHDLPWRALGDPQPVPE